MLSLSLPTPAANVDPDATEAANLNLHIRCDHMDRGTVMIETEPWCGRDIRSHRCVDTDWSDIDRGMHNMRSNV